MQIYEQKAKNAKYKEKHYDKNISDDNQLSFIDKAKIRWQAIMGKGELTPFLIFIIFN